MSFAWSNGTKQGIAQILQSINAQQQHGGSSPLGGLLGANKLGGGITLNPDGTVASVSPVKPEHHILDAIFNHGNATSEAQRQNALMQQSALHTTQGMTADRQQNAAALQMQAQHATQLQDAAVKQSLMDYGKANNITVFRADGSLTDAGAAAQSQLDPEKVKASLAMLQQQEQINAAPEVQAARQKQAVAQAQSTAVQNAAASRSTTPLGGTTVSYDPANPTDPVGVATGGTPSSSSISSPVVKMFNGIPYPMGEQSSSQSGVHSGGYQEMFPVSHDIQSMIRSTNSDGTVKEAQPSQTQYDESSVKVPDSVGGVSSAKKPINWKGALSAAGDIAQSIASLSEKQHMPVDMSTSNNLLNQGAAMALNPSSSAAPPIVGGFDTSSITPSIEQLNPQVTAAMNQQPSGGSNDESMINALRRLLARNNVGLSFP